MKPLLVLGKIFFVGCLWSIFFIEGIRVILLINWHFDIFWPPHWAFLWQTWHDGWVIRHAKEWAFILILLAAVPMWLTGWIALSVINWHKLFNFVIINPIKKLITFIRDLNAPIRNEMALKKVVKKKSYKEIRPSAHNLPVETFDTHPVSIAIKAPEESHNTKPIIAPSPKKEAETAEKKPFVHSVFEFDNDDDDFDLDFDSAIKTMSRNIPSSAVYEGSDTSFDNEYEENPYPRRNKNFDDDIRPRQANRQQRDRTTREDRERKDRDARNYGDDKHSSSDRTERKNNKNDNRRAETAQRSDNNSPIVETLRQKGYEIINGISIRNTYVDYIAVSDDKLYLCLVDKETGDWLADEERFNDEEPLWFSESTHRISPVRLVDIARNILAEKLDDSNMVFDIRAYVIVQSGNIINAEDMFEIWDQLDVTVTRINRGSPKELPLFSKSVDEVEERIDNIRFENLKKLVRSIK